MFWYWLFVGPALLLAILSLRGERSRAKYFAARLETDPSVSLPPATVIVPVKGDDDGLRENLQAFAALDYPDYELIVAAQKASDIPPGVLPARVRVVLAHDEEPNTAEKIQNLQAAVRAARRQSDIFAFGDSDARPGPGWLSALAAPLSEEGVGASTGFRWFIPDPPTFWTVVRGVWDGVATGRLGPGDNPFVWGGAMAIHKRVFAEARVAERWKNTVSDDYALADAVHEAGLSIAFAPRALTASYDRVGGRAFFSWARRQMLLTRRYRPKLWLAAWIAHFFYCGGMVASAAAGAGGNRMALGALAAQLAPGMLKAWNRASLAQTVIAGKVSPWIHAIVAPVATWLWLAVLTMSAYGQFIEWRGSKYDLWKGTAGR